MSTDSNNTSDTIKLSEEQTEFLRKALTDAPVENAGHTQILRRRDAEGKQDSPANAQKLKIQPL